MTPNWTCGHDAYRVCRNHSVKNDTDFILLRYPVSWSLLEK